MHGVIVMSKKQGFTYLIITFVLWGSLYVVSKFVLGKMPTFTISFLRFALAFVALSFISRGKNQKIEKKDRKYIVLVGVAGYFIAVGAQLLGTGYAGASLASLLNSMNPVTMTLFAAILLGEKLNWKKIGGILLALAGVYAIIGTGSSEISVSGVLLSLFSVLLWSLVAVFTRKVTQKYPSLQVTRLGAGIAALCYLPICISEIISGQQLQLDGSCVLSLLYMGIICTGIAYYLWNKSLSIIEAGTCSAFYPIQPLVSTVLGVIFLKEQVGFQFFLGAAFIVFGVLLNLRGGRDSLRDTVRE